MRCCHNNNSNHSTRKKSEEGNCGNQINETETKRNETKLSIKSVTRQNDFDSMRLIVGKSQRNKRALFITRAHFFFWLDFTTAFDSLRIDQRSLLSSHSTQEIKRMTLARQTARETERKSESIYPCVTCLLWCCSNKRRDDDGNNDDEKREKNQFFILFFLKS